MNTISTLIDVGISWYQSPLNILEFVLGSEIYIIQTPLY